MNVLRFINVFSLCSICQSPREPPRNSQTLTFHFPYLIFYFSELLLTALATSSHGVQPWHAGADSSREPATRCLRGAGDGLSHRPAADCRRWRTERGEKLCFRELCGQVKRARYGLGI